MSISSIGSSGPAAALQAVPRPEGTEVKGAPDHDGDAEDRAGAKVQAPAPSPVANAVKAINQSVGTVVSTKA